VPDAPPDGYAAAGRTDAGVSAVRQTVSFDAPEWLTPAALNGELPADVRAWASADVPGGFHAQYDARARVYEYQLHAPGAVASDSTEASSANPGANGAAWTDRRLRRARAALDRLSGRHDVHNLTPDDDGTERDVAATCERAGPFLVCRFEAGGFPREFVRRAVTLVERVATGERDPSFVDRVLSAEPLSGPDGIGPAPPEPLLLCDVRYDVSFERDEAAAESARSVFERRRRTRLTGARVAGRVGEEIG
jgi:tRNA pseudouridine38-40 synthase